MSETRTELIVGIFVLIGLAALAYLSVRLGKLEFIGSSGYRVTADFDSASGLKPGAAVEIGLDKYRARVALRIVDGVVLQDDAFVSIKTKGLIGEKFVRITPGGSDKIVKDGDRLRETESPIELEELVAKFIHGKL